MTTNGILKIEYSNNLIELNITKYTILVGEDHYILNFIIKILEYLNKIINKDLTINLKIYNKLLKFISKIIYNSIKIINYEDEYLLFSYDNGGFTFNNKKVIKKNEDIIFDCNNLNVHPNYLFDIISSQIFKINYCESKIIIYTHNADIINILNLYINVNEMSLIENDEYIKYNDIVPWTYFIPFDKVSSYNITKNIIVDNLDYLNKNIKTNSFNILKLESKLKQLESI